MAIKTFTTGEVLTASDTNTFLANAGLVYITSTTFTASSAVQIDNCFTSTYSHYLLSFVGAGSGTANDWIRARIVDGTTPQIGAIYYGTYAYSGTAAMTTGYLPSATSLIIGLLGNVASQCFWTLCNPQAASNTTGFSNYISSSNADFLAGNNSHLILSSTQYEGVQVYPNAGTMTGTITVYGYRKA